VVKEKREISLLGSDMYLDRKKKKKLWINHQFCSFLKQNVQLLLVTTDSAKKEKNTFKKFLLCE